MHKKEEAAPICVSNNMLLASYPSADPIHNKIIGSVLRRFSDALKYDTNDLFGGAVETAPIIADSKEYGISKIRLMEKCEELAQGVLIRFPYHLPNGEAGKVSAPILKKIIDREQTSTIEIYINDAVIPELRYAGKDTNGKAIGMTRLPENINSLDKPYSWRISELLTYMEQHNRVYEGWLPIIPLGEGGEDGKGFLGKLGIPQAYRSPNKLSRRILEPALKNIYDKTGKEYTYFFRDKDGRECMGSMRPAFIQFRLLFSKNDGSTDNKMDEIYRFSRDASFPDELFSKMMYAARDETIRDTLYADLAAIRRKNMPKAKAAACFKKTIDAILLANTNEPRLHQTTTHE